MAAQRSDRHRTSFAVPYVTAALASYATTRIACLPALSTSERRPDPVFGLGLVQGPKACIQPPSQTERGFESILSSPLCGIARSMDTGYSHRF